MNPRHTLAFIAACAILLVGCQQSSKQNPTPVTVGRTGPQAGAYGAYGLRNPGSNKLWGQVTNQYGDQSFDQELQYYTYPQLSQTPDGGVGYVSSQSNQSTGAFFTGNARSTNGSLYSALNGGNGANLDSVNLEIDIYDDRVNQYGPIVHPYTGGSGVIQGGYVQLNFQDSTSLVTMIGYVSGQTFSGQIYYSNQTTGGQSRQLGDFQVPVCGFFQCN